jgi:uncharacterized protein (UPF0332 family)
MQWNDFQDTAERLALGTTEGDWRSAISRGYYAVFHFFREFLLSHGLDVGPAGQSHFNLYIGLLNCGFPQVAAIASRIDALRAHRVRADYVLARPIRARDSQASVKEAKSLVADFQALLAALPPSQIVGGARQHLQSTGRLGRQP